MKTEQQPANPLTTPGDCPSRGNEAAPASLALIVGLGNPGPEYASHRHNIGFRIVQALADAHGLAFARHKKANARVAEGKIRECPVLLAKPQTFMNLSGKTVARLSREREIPPDRILVIHDDLDLPLGRLRLRPNGGSGGHNGLRSIIESLHSQDFVRLRVGIDRPAGSLDPADYVLRPFRSEEQAFIASALDRAVEAVESWLADGIVAAMDRFNRLPPNADDDTHTQKSDATVQATKAAAGQPALLPPSLVPLQLSPGSEESNA